MLKEFISDHNAVFVLTGNVLKVTICEDGYCEEKSFQLSETEAENIRENGTFDFSYLDEISIHAPAKGATAILYNKFHFLCIILYILSAIT